MIYLDSSYVVRLYFQDPGYTVVRQLAESDTVACAQHGRAEVIAALHRKFREGSLTSNLYRVVLEEFAAETTAGAFVWLPISEAVHARIQRVFAALPRTVFLRAADAIHLAAAAEHGLQKIFSNDTNLLAAARSFGLRGINIIG